MDWGLALATTATGMVVVFAVLILLVVIVWALGKLMVAITDKPKKEKKAEPKAEQQAAQSEANNAPVFMEAEAGISDEVVAAISAAISVIMSAEGKSYRLRSVKRIRESRPVWSVAGIQENTRPF